MAQKHDTPEYVDAPMTRAGTLELVASRRQIRSDAFTAVRWAAVNPILQLGEIGYETDTNKLKVGDGVTEWNDLGYVGGGSSLPDQDGHSGEFLTTDGTDASWATPEAIKVNTTATLAVADWSSSTQTVTVSGVKADSVVFVSPDPTSASDYASAGILCTAQAANSLTFTCTTTPTNAITVNVICL